MNDFSPNSRVWIYQSNRLLTDTEVESIQTHVNQFCAQWASHSKQLKAAGKVVDNLFVVLMADESQAGASGCSIDSSVHFIKGIEQHFELNLFDRMTFAFDSQDGVALADRTKFEKLYKEGQINDETLVFDTLVKTKADFDNQFKKPLSQSWHQRFV